MISGSPFRGSDERGTRKHDKKRSAKTKKILQSVLNFMMFFKLYLSRCSFKSDIGKKVLADYLVFKFESLKTLLLTILVTQVRFLSIRVLFLFKLCTLETLIRLQNIIVFLKMMTRISVQQ